MNAIQRVFLAFAMLAPLLAGAQVISPTVISRFQWNSPYQEIMGSAEYVARYQLYYVKASRDPGIYTWATTRTEIGKHYLGYLDEGGYLGDSVTNVALSEKWDKAKAWQAFKSVPVKRRITSYTVVDLGQQEVICQDKVHGIEYTARFPYPKLAWTLTKGDTVVMGVSCKRATTSYAGREYVAYYSLDHRVPYGPYIFHGLPGLIFALYDTEHVFNFSLASFEKVQHFVPIYLRRKFDKTEKVSGEELRKLLNNNYMNATVDTPDGRRIKVYYPYNPMERD